MAMVIQHGWCLPSPNVETLEGAPVNFFLNLHAIVSSRPTTLGGQAGYLLLDDLAMAYFVVMTEAEMSTLAHQVQ